MFHRPVNTSWLYAFAGDHCSSGLWTPLGYMHLPGIIDPADCEHRLAICICRGSLVQRTVDTSWLLHLPGIIVPADCEHLLPICICRRSLVPRPVNNCDLSFIQKIADCYFALAKWESKNIRIRIDFKNLHFNVFKKTEITKDLSLKSFAPLKKLSHKNFVI